MIEQITENEQMFRGWLRKQFTPEGVRRYTDNALIAYAHALRTGCRSLSDTITGDLFLITDEVEFDHIYEQILQSPDFEQLPGNGTLLAALKLYRFFLHNGVNSEAPDISAPFYLKQDISHDIYSESMGVEFHYEEIPMKPLQKIYYGVPGTGKSYKVRCFLESLYPDPAEQELHCRRVIFHPTYTYEDFIGSIKPLLTQDRPLTYVFTPGPLTVLLKEAFLNPSETYYLVIEEINRGNAPAIFGDLFQLLDRDERGKSQYSIQSHDISGFFMRDPGLKNLFAEGRIWLPSNFNILATMNTADENIFILDNAFKRRFSLEYVRISFQELPPAWITEWEVFSGSHSLTGLFHGTPLEGFALQLAAQGKLVRNWPTFSMLVNQLIDLENRRIIASGRPELARVPENKKLGPFFVTESDLESREAFLNKVIFYLKQDVFPASTQYLLDSYEAISMKYQVPGADLFELLVPATTIP